MKNRLLTITRDTIPYVKELRPKVKSVASCILMQQLDFWFNKLPNGFYKFLEPCPGHPDYKEGDSWVEELGFSAEEFKTSFANIGYAYKSKSEFDQATHKFSLKGGEEKFYCSYYDRQLRKTFYFRNHSLVDKFLDSLISPETDNPGFLETEGSSPVTQSCQFPRNRQPRSLETDNPGFPETDNPGFSYIKDSEITRTENTTEITNREGEVRVPAQENPTPSSVAKVNSSSILENQQPKAKEINKLPSQSPPRPIKLTEPQGLIPKNFQPAEDTIKAILLQVGSSYVIDEKWVNYQLHTFRSVYEGRNRTELDWDLKFVTWCLKQAPEDYAKGLLKAKDADSTTSNQLKPKELSYGREKLSSIDAEAEAKRIRRERREAEQRRN